MQDFLLNVQDLINFLEQYKLAIGIGVGWFLHKFVPYCKENGGLKTVLQTIWYNPPPPTVIVPAVMPQASGYAQPPLVTDPSKTGMFSSVPAQASGFVNQPGK